MKINNLMAKKLILSSFSCALIVLTIFSFCACKQSTDKVRVGTLYGPTSIAASAMFDNKDEYSFTSLTDASAIVSKLDAGDLDIALIPSNFAAELYNKEHNIKMVSIVNLCSVKVVSQDRSIKSSDDIHNQKIYSTGETNVVGAIISMLSHSANYNPKDANVIYKKTVEEVLSNVSSDPKALGIVTQPQASKTSRLDNDIYEVIDVTDEWHYAFGKENNPVTAVTVVSNKFLENNKDKLLKFLDDEKSSVKFANESPAETAYIINKLFKNTDTAYDATDVINSKVVFYDGQEMKRMTNEFFKMIYDYDPSFIGNIIPDDNFYYINE